MLTIKDKVELSDAADRDFARLELGSNVIVEAGAGTGKTTLLIDRILFLLVGGGLEISRLVALTFTEKAAAEIKIRLADRLNELSALLLDKDCLSGEAALPVLKDLRKQFPRKEEEYLASAEASLRGLEQAQIGTIHSFCSHLLRLFPLEAAVDPEFRVDADGTAFEEMFELEWALWLDRELGEEAARPDLWERVLGDASLEALRELAHGLANPRVDLGAAGVSTDAAAPLRRMAEQAGEIGKGKPTPKGKILEYLEWMSKRFKGEKGTPPSKNPPSWPKNWPGDGRKAYERLTSVSRRLDPDIEPLFRDAVALVRDFTTSLRNKFRRHGWISFDGLLVGARNLLRDHASVREETKKRFGAILIDEFQDTDPLQGELLMFLSEEEGRSAATWQKTRLAPGKLFVVGDEKQSIYRFRGADIAAVEAFTEHLVSQGAKRCALWTNFRSRKALLDPVNAVFGEVMRPLPGFQPAYRKIASAPKREGGEPPIWIRIAQPEGTKVSAGEGRRAEASWIADWILNKREKFNYRDIAIVVRTTTDLIAYLDALKAAAIPYAVEAEKYFYGTQEVSDFLNLLRAIDDPADPIALVGLLRSPLAALEDREIYDLARAGKLDYRKRVPALESFYSLLRRFHAVAGRIPLGDLMREVLRETFLIELCSKAYHHQQTASNLMKFGRLASEASERGTTLKEFIAEVSRSKREMRDEGESPLADESYDAVRILTIHKAKGLEYPVVFLPNLSGTPMGRPSEDAVKVGWTSGAVGLRLGTTVNAVRVLMDEEEKRREKEEAVRVLYVAMTRPKERLFLIGNAGWKKGCFSALLDAPGVMESSEVDLNQIKKPVGRRKAVPRPFGLLHPKAFAASWKAREKFHSAAQERQVFTHPTASHENAGYGAREETDPPATNPLLLGRLCHEVLERWDYANGRALEGGLSLKALMDARARILEAEEPQTAIKPLAKEVGEILRRFLASKTAKFLAEVEILGREIPLLCVEGGTVVRGTIDLMYRSGSDIVVADYKTDRAGDAKQYESQGGYYVRAVERALGVRGVKFEVIFLRGT